MNLLIVLACGALAYVLGSIPFGVLIPKILGRGDPRTVGSGNIGTTNVYRMAGLKVSILVFLADFLKGLIAAWGTLTILGENSNLIFILLPFSVLGHVFSCFLRFKGGKGVATAAGVLFFIQPFIISLAILLWALLVKIKTYPFLASLLVGFLITLSFWILKGGSAAGLALFLLLLLVWTHRSNLARWRQGREYHVKSEQQSGF
ncbi:MAG: acyl-phosphate glycerol 3-phosphate acyltransferase [Alphaproteobacteria bacterium 40-19]|nr:MAG: acyl-phosphate glycerol 3-phosphate acyltransferase [Alphaproteobacteria bacterium 40-19]